MNGFDHISDQRDRAIMRFELGSCPECGAGYPVFYSPKGETGVYCDACGYAAGDTKRRLDG